MTINSPAAVIWAMYLAVAEKQGADWKKISRHAAKRHPEGIYRAERIYLSARAFDAAGDRYIRVWRATHSEIQPHFDQRLSYSRGRLDGHSRTGVTCATASSTWSGASAAGSMWMNLGRDSPSSSTPIAISSKKSPSIARRAASGQGHARALRLEESADLGVAVPHADGGLSLTAQQPYNNVVRTAIQALAAVLGGTQSLHTNSLDEAWALPTEFAATLALRTQQIIAHESGVTNTADPLGGSYFVETLTNEVERGAWEYIEKIDTLGGMVAAIERSYPQREIAEASYQYQMAVDSREKIIVGVNDYVAEEKPLDILQIERDGGASTRRYDCSKAPGGAIE